jgi:SAM-dependent methyltransferase
VTRQLAQRVAPTGSVVGVDSSPEVVAGAQAAAQEDGVGQVSFRQADAYALGYRDTFDVVYARPLLMYLDEPVAALREMVAAAAPRGIVVAEEIFTDTLRSEPATPALDDLRRIYGATVRAHGGDPTIGPRLPALFRRAGLVQVDEAMVVNEMHAVEEKSFLLELVDSMRPAMLASSAATDSEIDRMRAGIAEAANDPDCTFFQAQTHQVHGVRPS